MATHKKIQELLDKFPPEEDVFSEDPANPFALLYELFDINGYYGWDDNPTEEMVDFCVDKFHELTNDKYK